MDEEVYVRVFPWHSSEARLSWDVDGNSQSITKESRDRRRERGPRAVIAVLLLTTGPRGFPTKIASST